MKNILILCLFFNYSFYGLQAQAPQAIPYQAVARDNSGNIIANQNISLRFSVLNGSVAGTVVYRETQSVTTNILGFFSVNLGQGSVVSGNFSAIDWGGGSKFIKVEMDGAGGNSYIDMGTQQLLSVPYALLSVKSSDNNWSASGGNIYNNNNGNVGVGTSTPLSSAQLDVSSTTKGFLMPRMTTAQRNAIASPVVGLQVFNTDNQCVNIYDGSNWIETCGLMVTGVVTDPGHPSTNSWLQKTNFGGVARYDAVGFSIGSKGYIGTGYIYTNGNYLNDFWEYDPITNSWTQKANFGGVARSEAVGFSIDSKGYIGTGNNGSNLNDFWEYDPVNNTWTQKTNFGGTARKNAVGFSIGSKGYIGTGFDGSGNKNDFWEYDPANNNWMQKANVGGSIRTEAVGFSIGSKGYIGTGINIGYNNDFWEYDPVSNNWTQMASFAGTSRYDAVGFSMGTKGYIGTGWDGTPKNDFWEYDPVNNNWTQKANLAGVARYRPAGFSIGNKGYIGTGVDNFGTLKNDLWEYMDNNIVGNAYSSNAINTTISNSVSNGAWTLINNTVYNANSGNVGIGTTSPVNKLDIEGAIAVGSNFSGTSLAPTNGAIIEGNVGIGMTNPTHKLDVYAPTGGVIAIGDLASSNPLGYFATTSNAVQLNSVNNHPLTFQTLSSERMRISNTGNVGIGTTSPVNKLDVQGGMAVGSAYSGTATAPANGAIIEGNTGIGVSSASSKLHVGGALLVDNNQSTHSQGAWLEWNKDFSSGKTYLLNQKGSGIGGFIIGEVDNANSITSRLYIDQNGNVGIGSTNPTQKLHVVGNACVTGTVSTCSDIRYKKSIQPISNALGHLVKLQGVSYYWKKEEYPDKQFDDRKQIGIIAQEAEKIYPELVLTDTDGYKWVDYSKLTPILIEAIKELKAEINQLKEENTSYKSDINLIKAQLGLDIKTQK